MEGSGAMKSIDNLREYALTAASVNATTRAVLAGYIDEIERDVAELTDERDLLKTQWEAGVDFDQRLEACAESREDVTLFGVDYTPLPLDADGMPIHVGDVMEWMAGGTFEVVGIGNGGTLYYLDTYDDGTVGVEWTAAGDKRHHHAPTVEDVLREFAGEWIDVADGTDEERELFAKYAAKLRLAGEE